MIIIMRIIVLRIINDKIIMMIIVIVIMVMIYIIIDMLAYLYSDIWDFLRSSSSILTLIWMLLSFSSICSGH